MHPFDYQALAMRTRGEYNGWKDQIVCAALGLTGESGEFADMVKKSKYQGHWFDESEAVKELGDICWYLALACDALEVSLEDVMAQNIEKLKKRYPGKGFDAKRSVNREDGGTRGAC